MPESESDLVDRDRVRHLADAVDREAVAAAVLTALRTQGDRTAAITPVVRDHVRMFTRMLLSGTHPPQSETRSLALRSVAASRSPIDEMLRSYRVGADAACRAVRAAAGPDDLAAVVTVTEELMAFINLMTAAVVQASLDDRDLRRSERERRFRRLFDAIDGAAALTPDLVELAEDIGIPTTGPYLPFAAAHRGAGAAEHARLAAELSAAGGLLAFSEGERIDGICSTPGQLDWLSETEGIAVAVGAAAARGRLAAACRDLHVVIDVAVRRGRTGPIGLADFAPEVLVELCPEVSDALSARVYDPLPAELQATLHALVAFGFDRTTTAATLHIHRNTLLYRLGRIEERLGLDLSRAADQVSIYLATLRRDRTRGNQPPPGAARRRGITSVPGVRPRAADAIRPPEPGRPNGLHDRESIGARLTTAGAAWPARRATP
ncbi:PucR family transcriptional regulator [Cryptosporangium phraense]|uniref:PucR family transcriptional regulator n=1 Tax=Cryptosporangium phraense TaxID=2593070 RepID=A0A545AVT1_9ACTN|nr:helix-turn-helix domain-containing protein [Cryptosporangium phraense]TQS45448.1 PucR family transcriptional regulator [Cryptosporangium phraense]